METTYQSQLLTTAVKPKIPFLFHRCNSVSTKLFRKKITQERSLSLANMYLCRWNSERSLAIQNNVLQCTPLISKSLLVHPPESGNTLLSSEIIQKRKILRVLSCSLRFLGTSWKNRYICREYINAKFYVSNNAMSIENLPQVHSVELLYNSSRIIDDALIV